MQDVTGANEVKEAMCTSDTKAGAKDATDGEDEAAINRIKAEVAQVPTEAAGADL